MAELDSRRVLVGLITPIGQRNRPVLFSGEKEELQVEIRRVFSDLISPDTALLLSMMDNTWDPSMPVELLDQEIPDKAVLTVC